MMNLKPQRAAAVLLIWMVPLAVLFLVMLFVPEWDWLLWIAAAWALGGGYLFALAVVHIFASREKF